MNIQLSSLILGVVLSIQGCSGLPTMGNGIPADGIMMGPRDTIIISSTSKRTRSGIHIRRYYCIEGGMVCSSAANTSFCSCQRELILPSSMRF